ncbi:MAG: FRG domain-containing protein [Acidimicrobiales bacterium]
MTFYFRGQEDESWGISSSLYRAVARSCQSGEPVEEWMLRDAEKRVINTMRDQGLGYRMSEGELLMVLQHHLIPTRLVDVSTSARPALYFAAESQDSIDGRLFIIGLHQRSRNTQTISLQSDPLPWATSARRTKAESEWTSKVALVDEQPLDPRMRAQQGRFLAGGIRRRYGGMAISLAGKDLPASMYPEICVLNLFPPRRGARKPVASRSGGAVWSLRIPAEWKAPIREALKNRAHMTKDHMYPPYDESRRLGVVAAEKTTTC